MSKYINADEYRKVLNGESDERTYCINENAYDDGLDRGLGIAIDILDKMPSADVVEVVRCKDCKHWNKCRFLGSDEIEEGLCRSFSDWGTPIRYDNDFCSYGERKETE